MKLRTSLAVALVAVAAVFTGTSSAADDSDVIALTSETFNDVVKPAKLILVEFYTPRCGHCRKFAPEYEEAATALKAKDIKVTKVDCEAENDLCHEYGIQSVPTVKVFRDGAPKDYTGARKADAVVSFMNKQALPALSELNADNIDEFKDSDNVVVVGFFSGTDSEEYKVLDKVANRLRDDYIFGATVDAKVAEKFKATVPGIILFKQFDDGKDVFDGKFADSELTSFVKINALPLMAELGPDNFNSYIDSKVPLAYLFVASDEDRNTVGKDVEEVAKEFKGKISFVHIDATKYGAHSKNLNLNESWPAFVLHDTVENLKYPFDQSKAITAKAIRELAQTFVDGTAVPSIKSEPIPGQNDEPVTVVVSKTFDKVVKDTEKDVLIEFYAPWCPHCKSLIPVYEKLGSLYKPSNDIVIAKMNVEANDLPPKAGVEVKGFPTIKLCKAKDNAIAHYSGDRSLESLVQFIKENAVSKFTPDTSGSEELEDAENVHDEL